MKIAKIWNKLAKPKNIPRLFAAILALVLLISIIIPTTLDVDQLYPRMEPQIQMDNHDSIAPYDRGGEILKEKGITKAEYPENSASIGWINSYMSPISDTIRSLSPYFGTSIYSSPGGLIDEILYYTRGFDTILESSILMMAFIIASWLMINFTMDRRNEKEVIQEDVKKAIIRSDIIANEVEESNRKARLRQRRKEG
ncbi:MAG: EhaF family protein [archaeon]|nr:EhaF family protein [archaeon]